MQNMNVMTSGVKGTNFPDQVAELRADWERMNRKEAAGPPDHMTVQSQINVIGQDMRQLIEDIGELRARLSPVLAEYDVKPSRRELTPVKCGMAAELGEIHMTLLNAREAVELTMMQLDIN